MKLIVGLGNPGREYDSTRHNVGFEVVESLRQVLASDSRWTAAKKFKAETVKARIEGEEVVLVRPTTFMNLSGEAVGAAARFWKLAPADIWTIHDDLDLSLGTLRIVAGASSAGHKGVQSVIEAVKSSNFPRFRLGIAPDGPRSAPTEVFVLDRFTKTERKRIDQAVSRATQAVIHALRDGIADAMSEYNKKNPS
ncbi:aminoacyl-tRNA hydrolase [Candidatus Uhrbacteria bacterium RIFCSPHIGHO2_02_FULL_57_19]|uniref:Peptidyl-tRNA hydrolase n=1 Tax=Candidatus Uhrbacteria bacterium RIFCSPHIGHO2_02_FULL_57_19 TaxID=1802391 RepID=A0A1F7U7L9_9BACT|nr:MAG: aminoacyl-tRNA hydrolase [Candidatus Uhrbacteria bacterium RIFCSPHIGHO2_02_FULL_57_19]